MGFLRFGISLFRDDNKETKKIHDFFELYDMAKAIGWKIHPCVEDVSRFRLINATNGVVCDNESIEIVSDILTKQVKTK